MKKFVTCLVSAVFALALIGCGGSGKPGHSPNKSYSPSGDTTSTIEASGLISVMMPTEGLERWNKDGAELKRLIEDRGYEVDLVFSNNKPEQQIADLENQINKGSKFIILSPIDGNSVGPAVEKAKAAGITVLAYDRMIMNTNAVDYYVSFGLEAVGQAQAQYIIDQLGLKNDQKGPFNIEVFSGSPDDNNSRYFLKGAWDELAPYFKSGVLVSPSGAVSKDFKVDQWKDIGILGWNTEIARQKMEARLAKSYADKSTRLHAVLAANDSTSVGFQAAVEASGLWAVGSKEWPIFVGQDADVPACYNMNKGLQAFTVWKDTRILADKVAEITVDLMQGNTPKFTDSMNNGLKDVPSLFLPIMGLTKDGDKAKNYMSIKDLVGSGYVKKEQIETGKS